MRLWNRYRKQPATLTEAELRDRLALLREIDYSRSFSHAVGWLKGLDRGEYRPAYRTEHGAGAWVRAHRFSLAATCLALVISAGFMPVQQVETVGHLVHWTVEGNPGQSLARAGELGLPQGQIVHAPHPLREESRFVLLLPQVSPSQAMQWVDLIRHEGFTQTLEHVVLQEEVNRPIYDAFFANLPPSLREGAGLSRSLLDRRRFSNLAIPYVHQWLNTASVTYNLSSGYRGDSLWFNVTPYSHDPLPPGRERLFDEYGQVDRAIHLLEGADPRVMQARALLEIHRDSLHTLIYGNAR